MRAFGGRDSGKRVRIEVRIVCDDAETFAVFTHACYLKYRIGGGFVGCRVHEICFSVLLCSPLGRLFIEARVAVARQVFRPAVLAISFLNFTP